ncbi:MAG TPA: ADOP family duplicated permease [Vicinamibacterales bacterium]|nr:ADOP family duplicated permease [Vicinamibacterales bacterium]
MTRRPPRLAEWLLERVLPVGKLGDSIRGDLIEEFHRLPAPGSRFPSLWFWQHTLRLCLRYAIAEPPQPRLNQSRRVPMWFDLTGDLKTALRAITRAPGTSSLIVLTLAFAIAAATIGFSFADLALLRGLPVDDKSRVVTVSVDDPQRSMAGTHRVSGPDFLDYRARATTLENFAAFRYGRAPLIREGQSQTLAVTYATADVFAAMGQRPFAGRVFIAGDDRPGAPPVVVLAHHYWQREMAGRMDAIGRTLQIGREHYTVVGIASPEMEFGNLGEIELWMPLHIDPQSAREIRNLRFLARLKDDVPLERAAAEMAAIGAALAAEHPRTNGGWTVRVVPATDLIGGDGFWIVISLFLLSVALLMAIATANVSNLVMVRTLARARELAVRTALGARRGRLVRQFVIEGFALSFAAATAAVPLAWAGLQGIQWISAEEVFRQLTIDIHEITFVATIALICPLVFSLSPIRQLSRPDMRHVLAAGGRGTTASLRGRGALVVVQVALAVILLTVSSVSLRSIRMLYAQPTGLDSARMLVFSLEFNEVQYPDGDQVRAAAIATRDELRRLAGVDSVAMLSALPILGDTAPLVITIDNIQSDAKEARPTVFMLAASADADRALGLTRRAGEWWRDGARDVAVISETAARRFFGSVDRAVGGAIGLTQGDRFVEARVSGVVSDVAHTDRTKAAPARVWVPLDWQARRFDYVVRAADPAALASQVRTVVATHAPAVPIESLRTMDAALARAAASDYAVIGMLGLFALLALVLASSGLFGVVSFGVAQRTAEFGTRMALGATAGDVVRLVAGQSLKLLIIGVAIGITTGIGIGFVMANRMAEITPLDPLALGGVIALLALVTIVATAWPALRASRIDPVIALRAE